MGVSVTSVAKIKQAIDMFPDDIEVGFVILNVPKTEIKLELKSVYNKIEFDSEESKINNKLIFVMEVKK
jgi:hypothetical protein